VLSFPPFTLIFLGFIEPLVIPFGLTLRRMRFFIAAIGFGIMSASSLAVALAHATLLAALDFDLLHQIPCL
jgi:hypothetical protein